jgi:hypothetical protein
MAIFRSKAKLRTWCDREPDSLRGFIYWTNLTYGEPKYTKWHGSTTLG